MIMQVYFDVYFLK